MLVVLHKRTDALFNRLFVSAANNRLTPLESQQITSRSFFSPTYYYIRFLSVYKDKF